jgi:hypothetical protein
LTGHSINIGVTKLDFEMVLEMLLTLEVATIGTTLEALLVGVHFTSFLLCLRWLIFSDDGETMRKPIQWPFLIITIILFAFSVTDLSFNLQAGFLFSQHAYIPTNMVNIHNDISSVRNPRTELMMG